MIKYVFRDHVLPIKNAKRADPQKIGVALTKISDAHKGKLLPKMVVDEARAPNHVLHRHFEWNNEVAAEAYRLDQARALIRCIDMVDDEDERPKPAFLSIADKAGTSYRTVGEVLASSDLQMLALKQAERDFEAHEKRLRAFSDLCAAIRDIRGRISAKRASLESKHAAA